MTTPLPRDAAAILEFWTGTVGPDRWYAATPDLDAEITRRFAPLWQRAAAGACNDWLAGPKGALALTLLLDQFPRNMFRGTARAFSSDGRARTAAITAIAMGHDRRTPEPERQFFYLPLMHSEMLPDQERCVRLIRLRMPETGREQLDHAGRHREVIRRFGRFPSRNAPLGRADTEAERAYRASGGYMA